MASHRGAKQSPFVGKRVPLVDGDGVPILYKRYTAVQEVVSGAATSVPSAAADPASKPSKKQKGKSRHDDVVLAPADGPEPPKKKQKLEQQLKVAAQDSSSADQEDKPAANGAAADSDADSIAARREARKREKKEKRRLRREKEAAEAAAVAAAAAARQQQEDAQKPRRRQESSESDSDSDSEDEDDKAQPAAAKRAPASDSEESTSSDSEDDSPDTPMPAAKAANSSSSSSDDSSDSSSDEEEEKEGDNGAAEQNGVAAPAADGGQAATEEIGSGGAGNAEEAGKIRSVMGFSQMSSKAAPSFRFGFSVEEQKAAEAEEKLKWIQMVDSAKDGYLPRRIYAGGMPFSWEEEQIREYWEFCGELEAIDMLRFPDTGRFRGLAFITFKTEEGFQAALQCDGEQCERGALKVMRCKPSMVRPSHKTTPTTQQQGGGGQQRGGQRGSMDGRPQKVPGFNVAYVGNIAFESSLEELQELFQPYGSKFIRMHTDKATGKFKGYAHVHFDDEDGLDRCMELDGNRLHGREMRVSYAQPKKNAGPQ